jgi:hypothetical protein
VQICKGNNRVLVESILHLQTLTISGSGKFSSTNKLHSISDEIYCQLSFVIYTSLSRCSGGLGEHKSVTFTK